VLTGVQMLGLSYADPDESQLASVHALNSLTFRVIRQRWNLNMVRLLVNPAIWERDGSDYIDRIAQAVRTANAENLVVNLAARKGAVPDVATVSFWSALAAAMRDHPMVVFSVYVRPEVDDWAVWRNGDGHSIHGMQTIVDAIRRTGAEQIVAVPALTGGFRGLSEDLFVRDDNLMYEIYPRMDQSDAERDASLGIVGARYPLLAGEWGAPVAEDSDACRSFPASIDAATEAVYGLAYYLGVKSISWSAASFEPAQLIRSFDGYEPTLLDRPWNCDVAEPQHSGIGGLLMLWLTGDPYGFGSIAPDQIASAAGGPSGPVAPGQVINIYGQLVGPEIEVEGRVDPATGRMSTNTGETQVFFDGIEAPMLSAGYFAVKVQVPFEVAGKASTRVTAWHRGVSSNEIEVAVTDVSPGIFTRFGSITDAVATNPNQQQNSESNPAAVGSVISLLATGYGQTSPAGTTGVPARDPLAKPALPVSMSIGGVEAELVRVAEAAGTVGVLQLEVRVPNLTGSSLRTVPVVLTIGQRRSRPDVRIWVR